MLLARGIKVNQTSTKALTFLLDDLAEGVATIVLALPPRLKTPNHVSLMFLVDQKEGLTYLQ
jgi:hypothetical protein